MNIQQFINEWNGRFIPSRGGETGQCVSLSQAWAQENGVTGTPVFPIAAAADMVNTRPDFFDYIPNTPDGVPQAGDIMVWNRQVGNCGHTAVFVDGNANSFRSFDENWPLKSSAHIQNHNYNGVAGWLRLKGGHDMINDTPNEFARYSKLFQEVRGRTPAHEEFINFGVGKTWLQVIEILSDDVEADATQHAQEVGQLAVKDDWQGQIGSLATQLAEANKKLAEAGSKPVTVPPTTVSQDTINQIAETNGIVKQIKNLLTKIFKGKK